MRRCARLAMSSSCVTRITVMPLAFRASNRAMISSVVRLSRAPVGSSASRMCGSLISARDCHTLLLTAGQLRGLMALACRKSHARKAFAGLLAAVGLTMAMRIKQRQCDIVERGGACKKIEGLEYEADLLVT